MSTQASASQLALRGLLLLVVEVQNILCNEELDAFEKLGDIEDVVETDAVRELIQLARAALADQPTPPFKALPASVAGVHS